MYISYIQHWSLFFLMVCWFTLSRFANLIMFSNAAAMVSAVVILFLLGPRLNKHLITIEPYEYRYFRKRPTGTRTQDLLHAALYQLRYIYRLHVINHVVDPWLLSSILLDWPVFVRDCAITLNACSFGTHRSANILKGSKCFDSIPGTVVDFKITLPAELPSQRHSTAESELMYTQRQQSLHDPILNCGNRIGKATQQTSKNHVVE